jgi:hypothetical protein
MTTFCFFVGAELALLSALRFSGLAITEDACNLRVWRIEAIGDLNRYCGDVFCEIQSFPN